MRDIDARDPHCTEAESPEDIARLWPRARHELLCFASHLRLASMATRRGEGPGRGEAP